MSKQIDERVVSMQFDNKHFESNVQTSLSTLDKLKRSLHLDGATKGLENVNSAAKKVDMSNLSNGVETVKAKFSALDVIGVTALANITNSAVEAGKRIVSALTIDPVKTGFNEYETQINAVQTILANTKHKGSTLDDVNKALDELNAYADQTIYNFTEMTKNIGLFTNAGVGLDESVAAIKGFSNAAAMAGADSTKTANALYQLSQGMSAGVIQLMDWRSLTTANVAGERFEEVVMETARVHGIAIDEMVEAEGTFQATLKDKWLTADLMAEALNHYTLSTETMTEAEQKAARARMKSNGYTDKQIDKLFELGTEANKAATEVKTFSQLWGVLQESAQSGWTKTWQLIVGDFDQAKALLLPLSKFLTGIVDGMSDFRNKIVEMVMGSPLGKLAEIVRGMADTAKGAIKPLKDYADIVNRIIRGDFGNQWDNGDRNFRRKLVEAAGYDYDVAQTLVNQKLGSSVKLTDDLSEAYGKQTVAISKTIDELAKMSDAQLKAAGYTDEQIKALRRLAKYAEEAGLPLSKFIETIDEMTGREMIIESFKNVGKGLVTVFSSMKDAWTEIFPVTAEDIALKIYGALMKIYEWSKKFDISKDTEAIQKWTDTFKGLFSALDIVLTIVGGPIKIVFKILSQLLGAFNLNILDVTAFIGRAITKFNDWLDSVLDFTAVFEWLAPYITDAAASIRDWVNSVKPLERIGDFFRNIASAMKDWFTGLKETNDIPKYIIEGFANGITSGASKVWDAIVSLGTVLLEKIKAVLGIHSPSTEFLEIGKNIILGLVNGLRAGISTVLSVMKTIGAKIIGVLQAIDWGAVYSLVIGAAMTYITNKAANALVKIASAFEGFGELLEGLGQGIERALTGFGKKLKAQAFEARAKGILSIAIAIGILAASVWVLSKVDPDRLWESTGVLAVLIGMVTLLSLAISKMNFKKSLKIAKVALLLVSVAVALGIMASALRKLAALSGDDLAKSYVTILGLGLIMAGLVHITKQGSKGKGFSNAGSTLLKMSAAILLLVIVVKQIAKMDTASLVKGIGFLVLFGAFIVGLMAATKLAGPNINGLGSTILKISVAILVLAFVARIIGGMDTKALAKGGLAIVAFGAIVVALIALTRLAGGNGIAKIGGTMIAISAAILLLALTARMIGGMDAQNLAKGVITIGIFAGIIGALIYAVKKAGPDVAKVGLTMLLISVAIGILATISIIMGFISLEHLARGIGAVTLLSGVMAGLLIATKHAKDCKGSLIVLAIAIAVMAAAVAALSAIDPARLAVAAVSLSLVIGVFALLVASMQYIKTGAKTFKRNLATLGTLVLVVAAIGAVLAVLSNISDPDAVIQSAAALSTVLLALSGSLAIMANSKTMSKQQLSRSLIALVTLTAVVAAIGAILFAMSYIPDPTTLIPSAAALSVMLLSMSVCVAILSGIGSTAKNALMGVLALAAMAVPLVAFVGVLYLMQNVQNALPNVLALTALATAMTVLLIPLTIIGAFGMTGAPYLGVLALLTMAIPLVAFVGVLALMQNIQNAQANANLLIGLVNAMTKVLVVLAIVGPLAVIGVAAMTALTGLMLVVGVLAVAIGALMEKFPSLQKFLNTGIPVMVQLAGGIGEMIGAFVGGILGGVAEQFSKSLPAIGLGLSQFMENATPFIEGIKMVDSKVLEGIGILAASILALVAADLLEGIVTFLNGGSSFATLGTELSNFMMNAMPFIVMSRQIDPEIMTGVKTLAEAILILCGSNMLDVITGWLGGESSLATFGSQLGQLGTDMKTFVGNLGTFTEDQVTSVKCAGEAIKALANAASTIPNDGGWLGAILGENSLATFGSKLPQLGTDIKGFVSELGTFTEDQVSTVDCAGRAIKALADAASTIPNDGGWLGAILGENSLATFGSKLPQLGTDLNGFITNLGTFDESSISTVDCAGRAIKALSDAAKTIPNEGGFWAKIVGDNSLATFGSKLPQLGTDIKAFVENLGSFDSIQSVDAACYAIKSIAKLGEIDLSKTSSGLGTLGGKLKDFGTKIGEFVSKISEVGADSITSAVDKTKELIELAKTVASTNVESLKTFGTSLKDVATTGVKGFVEAFTNEDHKTKVTEAAKTLLSKFIKGAEDKTEDVKKAFSGVAKAGVGALTTKEIKTAAGDAGKNVVTGFANGIKNNKKLATDAGSALGKAALEAAKEALDENSPSKEMYEVGDYAGLGFVNALDDYAYKAYQSGAEMAESARSGLSKAISKVYDIINSDIDAQPTIRPVLDLSDVKAGASSIGGMFGNGTLSVNTRTVGAVAASMAGYQNGGNPDVVSAIKGLRKDIANMPRNSYTVGNVTYDDGSNVASAVESLIRAARVERRS